MVMGCMKFLTRRRFLILLVLLAALKFLQGLSINLPVEPDGSSAIRE